MEQGFKCGICFEICPLVDVFKPSTCLHEICRDCAGDYIQSLIEQSKMLECFVEGCGAEWSIGDVELLLNQDSYDRLQRMLFNRATNTFHHCPKPNCNGVAEVVPPCPYFQCPVCNYRMCIACNNEYHPTVTCDEYRQWLEDNGQADDRFNEYINTRRVQVCPNCRQAVEKIEGCNHMTCRCDTHFCYLCGTRFNRKGWEAHGNCQMFNYDHIE